MRYFLPLALALALISLPTGCAGMTDEQQRLLSGAGIGAAGGAVFAALTGGGALLGAAVGGAAGVAGGAILNEQQRTKTAKSDKNNTAKVAARQGSKREVRAD